MSKDINDPKSVTAYIQKLDPEFAKLVNAVRELILSSSNEIGEHIKWNSPAFFYLGEMKAFDAKEYKRDLAVMHLRKGFVMLVFPTGASIPDKTGLLEGNYTDGRRLVNLKTLNDVKTKGKDLQKVIQQWLKQIEK
ncbi:MAG: DUF1801 domain-containing protein [Bacteroidia bacterium]